MPDDDVKTPTTDPIEGMPIRRYAYSMLALIEGIDEVTGKVSQFKISIAADGTIKAVRPPIYVDEEPAT